MSKRFLMTRQMMRTSKSKVSFRKKVGMIIERGYCFNQIGLARPKLARWVEQFDGTHKLRKDI